MKMELIAAVAALASLAACNAAPLARPASENSEVTVSLVTRWSDCELYRVRDGLGRSIYVSRCGEKVATEWSRQSGKVTIREHVEMEEVGQ